MYPTMKKTIDLFVSLENDIFAMIWIIKNILKSDWFISYRIVPNDERYKKYQFCLKIFFDMSDSGERRLDDDETGLNEDHN